MDNNKELVYVYKNSIITEYLFEHKEDSDGTPYSDVYDLDGNYITDSFWGLQMKGYRWYSSIDDLVDAETKRIKYKVSNNNGTISELQIANDNLLRELLMLPERCKGGH
jgi:hypothetical protein